MLVKSSLLQTNKSGKAGSKSGKNKGKKPATGGSKAKNKKYSKKKASGNKTKAKANSGDNKEKEDSTKEKEKNDPYMSVTSESFTSCHPSNPGTNGCGASMDYTVSSIPQGADWSVNLPLQSATEYMSAMGLHPETIVSRLSKRLGGRLAYSEDSYRTIGARERHIY